MTEHKFILKLSCLDQPGIVAALTTTLAARGANILEANQFCDRATNQLFIRIAFAVPEGVTRDVLDLALKPAVDRFDIKLKIEDLSRTTSNFGSLWRTSGC